MRKCYDKRNEATEQNVLYFHLWTEIDGKIYALVETKLGFMKYLEPEHIWLVDKPEKKTLNYAK
jgi:hypothetical protein